MKPISAIFTQTGACQHQIRSKTAHLLPRRARRARRGARRPSLSRGSRAAAPSMSNHAQSSSPFSRLSRLALPFKSTPSSPLATEPPSDDWYIPYHGPIEPPKEDRTTDERNTDSWGHLVSGWLMENDGRTERSPRIRAMSNASRAAAEEYKRKSSRIQPSFVKLDQAGGVGETPPPARPRRSQEAPLHHRSSLASILSFGTRKAHKLQHSSSAGDLRKDPAPPVPQGATQDSSSPPTFPRRHPYALATPAPSVPPPPPVSSPVVTTAPSKEPYHFAILRQASRPSSREAYCPCVSSSLSSTVSYQPQGLDVHPQPPAGYRHCSCTPEGQATLALSGNLVRCSDSPTAALRYASSRGRGGR